MMTQSQINAFGLQFISHHNEHLDQYNSILKALEGGCTWVQLRMKDASEDEVARTGEKLVPICKEYGAVLIIDDHVEVCKQIGADGVHLGKNDMDPQEAREILGKTKIIGGTCNTFADISRIHSQVDYIGLGPFRYTTTKEKLSPVIGLDGYRDIIWKCREKGINTPIVAIGGIVEADIADILESGPNGIAVSGLIMNAADPVAKTTEIVKMIRQKTTWA
ncbi:MAG: thiamine phosphate synthase [Bacteroidales bacterium]|nr:thiamine phosphate synthase [Bacteroidales bacterium]